MASYYRHDYFARVISRPELYNILVDSIPESKILLGKQVSAVQQVGLTATCECTDGSSYSGVIVGADGAYSSVRLHLYRQLKDQDLLPAQDRKPMQYRYQALVGMTRPLSTQESAITHSQPRVVVSQGKAPFTVGVLTYTEKSAQQPRLTFAIVLVCSYDNEQDVLDAGPTHW